MFGGERAVTIGGEEIGDETAIMNRCKRCKSNASTKRRSLADRCLLQDIHFFDLSILGPTEVLVTRNMSSRSMSQLRLLECDFRFFNSRLDKVYYPLLFLHRVDASDHRFDNGLS